MAWHHGGTILGRRDFVVIVRRWRERGAVRRPGVWTPAGVADSRELADAMVALLAENAGVEARAVSTHELLHREREEDRERILDLLNGRTTADIERDLALRAAAAMRLASIRDRRGGRDRRSGFDRRSQRHWSPPGGDRRSGGERRSGRDRRREPATHSEGLAK